MGPRLAAIVVESRSLVREALRSLMAKHSYRVVCDIGSAAEMSGASILTEGPKLVILGAPSADNALSEAVSARKLWPDSKIILLHESLSTADFQKLLTSEINGCVPLFASPDTLISMLDMIVTRDVRVMVVGDAKCPVSKLQSDGADHEDVSVSIGALQHIQPPANGTNVSDSNVNNGRAQCVPLLRDHPELSDRKARIPDGLVKGQANKVIARTCEITEVTVKVHMTSILRKTRLENRHAGGYLGDGEWLYCRRI